MPTECPIITDIYSHISPLHIYHCDMKDRRCRGIVKTQIPVTSSSLIQLKMEGMQMRNDKHFTIYRASASITHIKISHTHTYQPLLCNHPQDMRWDSHISFPPDFLCQHISEVYIHSNAQMHICCFTCTTLNRLFFRTRHWTAMTMTSVRQSPRIHRLDKMVVQSHSSCSLGLARRQQIFYRFLGGLEDRKFSLERRRLN